jgi:DNA-binding transcriptional regulator YhcF (GntR family)
MARFRPIKQFRVSRDVCEQLKQSILLGQFKAGDRLPSIGFGEILINMEKTYREKKSP